MKREGCIYLITNKTNKKMYVGSTKNTAEIRWSNHKYLAKKDTNCYFHKAIKKYGESSFKIEEICTVFIKSDLEELEMYFIDLFNTMEPNGYNTIDPTRWERLAENNKKTMLKEWADPEKRKQREESNQKAGESQAVPIVAVSIYDGSVKFYSRVHDARRDGFSVSSIYSALNKTAKTGQKQCWFYKTVDDPDFYKKQALDLIGAFKHDFLKPIEGINVETGEIVTFDNCEDLTNKGFQPKQVRRVIRGERLQAAGYYWRYKV